MKTLLLSAVLFAPMTVQTQAIAQENGVRKVRPLVGYVCMGLNVTPEVARNGPMPPVLSAPSATAKRLGVATPTVFVEAEASVFNGFLPVLHFDGRKGWMEVGKLRPWRSESNPSATCTPSLMSDGRPGIG